MAENSKLNMNQRRAIPALLEHGSIRGAAASLGLHERTIHRYLKDATFRRELNSAVDGLFDAAGVRLYSGQQLAIDELQHIIQHGEREGDRRLASVAWLQFVMQYYEKRELRDQVDEIIRRLDEIENR